MLTVSVRPDDGDEYQLKITARDALMWEKVTGGKKTTLQFLGNMAMVDLYKMSHISARRQQLFTGTLEEWEKTVEVIFETDYEGQLADIDVEDPTRPEVSSDESSS